MVVVCKFTCVYMYYTLFLGRLTKKVKKSFTRRVLNKSNMALMLHVFVYVCMLVEVRFGNCIKTLYSQVHLHRR